MMKSKTSKKLDSQSSSKKMIHPAGTAAKESMDATKPVSKSVGAVARKEFSDLRKHLSDLILDIDENKLSYSDLEQFAHRAAEHLLAHFALGRPYCKPGETWCPGHRDGGGDWIRGKCIPDDEKCEAKTTKLLLKSLKNLS
jgi:hypothetical protein